MNRQEQQARLLGLMQNQLKLAGAAGLTGLSEELRLNEDLRIDSVMLLQLLVYIEEEFGLQVPEDEVDPTAFQTVGSLLDFMHGLEKVS